MTNLELQEKLKEFPDDMEIGYENLDYETGGDFFEIINVDIKYIEKLGTYKPLISDEPHQKYSRKIILLS